MYVLLYSLHVIKIYRYQLAPHSLKTSILVGFLIHGFLGGGVGVEVNTWEFKKKHIINYGRITIY